MKVESAPDRSHRTEFARCSGGVKRLQRLADARDRQKAGSAVFDLRSDDGFVREFTQGSSEDTPSFVSGGKRSSRRSSVDGV